MSKPSPLPDDRPALVWFTRDLRLADQPALSAALASGRKLVACYVLDDSEGGPWAMGSASRWWLHHSLSSLAASLRDAGIALILRRGDSTDQVARLAREVDAAELHVGQPNEPAARAALDHLERRIDGTLHRHWTTLLFDPDSLRTQGGTVYGVFTPFAKACFARGVEDHMLPAPKRIPAAHPAPRSDALEDWGLLPTKPNWARGIAKAWKVGERAAHQKLAGFLTRAIARYATGRNLPAEPGTSGLSPHLHWGEISARTVWHQAARHHGAGTQTYLSELLWREFCAHLLWHHPTLPDAALKSRFDSIPWRRDQPGLAAWQQGRTGIPIVDAGMRELWQTGWQHNRVRMITASFLIKHLLIDWRQGEAWFWDCLVDADLGSNSANWQWVAGSGADAAPFFRIFNPLLQGQKFDPEGEYVRRYVPELANLPAQHIHAPWEAPALILRAAGITLGTTYPAPIVDLAEGRARALSAFHDLPKLPA